MIVVMIDFFAINLLNEVPIVYSLKLAFKLHLIPYMSPSFTAMTVCVLHEHVILSLEITAVI